MRLERSRAPSTLYIPATRKVYHLTIDPDQSRTWVVMRNRGTQDVAHSAKIEDVGVVVAGSAAIPSRVWEAEDFKGVPVKFESHLDHSVRRAMYRDITRGEPDPAQFAPHGAVPALRKRCGR